MRCIRSAIVTSLLLLGLALSAASEGAEAPAADRAERVLKGLRPRIEVEGAPVRWPLAERMAAYKVPAVSIAIIDGGRIVWAQGFGVKEVGGHDPVTATTLFQAASCSKPVAASAMLRLVEKGTLSLDKSVNDYLTSWKLPENEFTKQEPVTLRRLATHTGGTTVGGFPGYKVGVPHPTVPELLDGKAPANNVPVRVDKLPGQGFRYSGGGVTIIQQLLIDVTGTPFPTLLQQQVLGPLGMAHSTFEQPLPEARAADAARGHEKDAVVPGGWHVYPELAAAGLWTTPTDLATWSIAMADALAGRSEKFLSQATASQIISSAVPGRSAKERIGLGLFLTGSGDSLTFGHGGQNEGFLNEFKMFANTGKGAAIMINTGESGYGLIQEIQFAIAAEYGWPEIGTTKITAVAVDPADLDRLTGTYVVDIKSGRKLPRIVREGTRLYFEGWGPARQEMHPQSLTTFIGSGGTRLTFTRDAAGHDVMTMGQGPKALTGLKTEPGRDITTRPVANAGSTSKTATTQAVTRDAAVAKELVLDLGNQTAMKLTLIPAGKFRMGSPSTDTNRDRNSDETQHEVTLTKAFYMGVTEVTQKQYQAVMGVNPSRFKGENLPVEPVAWVEAVEFCKTLSEKTGKTVRLPTEAEWEYACRAGTTGAYAGTAKLDDMGWYASNSGGKTHPVASKKPNAWGLYDMHGNVWEWCSDWFGPYSGDATDPQGVNGETARTARAGPSRVMRGGCWFYDAARCRAATRGRGTPVNRLTGPGFRVALEVP